MTSFALVLSRAERARAIGDLAARLANRALRRRTTRPGRVGRRVVRTLPHAGARPAPARWHVITVATLAGHLTVFVLLLVCLRVTGITESEVTAIEAFAAWALVRILGALPLTPAGVGIRRSRAHGRARRLRRVERGGRRCDAPLSGTDGAPTLALGLLAAATWRTHQPGEAIGSRVIPDEGQDH